MGDINRDDRKARYPHREYNPPMPSVGDFLSGCPQTESGSRPGRLFFVYLTVTGHISGHTVSPADTDEGVGPDLMPGDRFGSALTIMQDWDKNGMREVAVGAPGDSDGGESAGAVYVMFYRRRRFHPTPFDFVTFICTVVLVPFAFCCLLWTGIAYFFWHFRRRPDPVEIIVKQSNLEINPNRKRPKYIFMDNVVHADNYTL
jgi:hypothetical protein